MIKLKVNGKEAIPKCRYCSESCRKRRLNALDQLQQPPTRLAEPALPLILPAIANTVSP